MSDLRKMGKKYQKRVQAEGFEEEAEGFEQTCGGRIWEEKEVLWQYPGSFQRAVHWGALDGSVDYSFILHVRESR